VSILESDSDISALLQNARTIAVVGLSEKPNRDSHRIARYLLRCGYTVIPVNPALDEVLGQKCYPDLESIRTPIDIVDVFRRAEFMRGVVDSAIRSGARAVWMQLETADPAAAEVAAAAGMDVVVERCIMVEHRRLLA